MDELIRNGTYAQGFEAGFRAIKGTVRVLPVRPVQPVTKVNSTVFLMGVRKGMEKALGKSISDIEELCDKR